MGKHEDKALKNILQGRQVEKKIQVAGYDKEFSEKMKQEREDERKANQALSDIMSKFRMPMFCPECNNLMTKRLNKKFWYTHNKCFECVVQEEHEIRLQGPEAWEEYETKKMKANANSWLRDQEQGFKEWKEMVLNPKDVVNEDGSLEKWSGDIKGQKKLVKQMQKEFDEMKNQILNQFK